MKKISYNYNKDFFLILSFYTHLDFDFHLLVDVCLIHDHIVTFFLFFTLERL